MTSHPSLFSQAVAHHSAGRLEQAEAAYRKVLALDPRNADSLHLLGAIAVQRGDPIRAVELIQQAIALNDTVAAFHANLGSAFQELNRLEEAIGSHEKALAIKPDSPEIAYNLANALRLQGKTDAAVARYEQAIALKPRYPEALANLGSTLQGMGKTDAAIDCFERALAINPNFAEALSNLGAALHDQGRLGDAIARHEQALALKPDYAEAYCNRGNPLKDQGRIDEAISSYRKALSIRPDYADAHSNLLLALNCDPSISPQQLAAEHRRWDEQHASKCARIARPADDRDPERRLRVGYVSPDFRQHSVAYFFEPLLREHDRARVEVFCYAEVARPDALTQRLRARTDHWLNTPGMSDAELARRISEDRIDLLVDLAGHTAHNRLLTFARKPATVQVNWLGYPHSTGLRTMDYRLVDAVTDPAGEADAWASETLVRLDDGFLCYAPPAQTPAPADAPVIANGYVTFASFNNPAKLSSATLDTWARLLEQVSDSRLLLKGRLFADRASRAAFLARLARHGVAAKRVTLLGPVLGLAEHLALYAEADIGLDPFPYNGATTTCEALWMGVPVVSLCGDRHAARTGASLLTRIGLTELIASSPQAYIDVAAALANDPVRVCDLRRTLRERVAASPLCDAPAFARKIEGAYMRMWRHYCGAGD